MKRTAADLIAELNAEAQNFQLVALCVGFANSTTFVFSNDPQRLGKLHDAMLAGGEPIGLVALNQTEDKSPTQKGTFTQVNEFRLFTRPLEEYAGDDWAVSYLEDLSGRIRQAFIDHIGPERVLEVKHGDKRKAS